MWNNWEQLHCVVHWPLIVGMTIALLVSLGTCNVQKQNVRLNFACKKTFESLGRSDYQCPQFGSVCQVRNVPFEDQTKSFFLSLGQRVYIFEESPKSIQDVIGDAYCPGKFCFNREKCESFDGYVTTPRSFCGFGKCGAWLFLHKFLFMLQEHVETTKNRQNMTSLCEKKMNFLPDKQLFFNNPFQLTKCRKEEMCAGNEVQKTFRDVYCPTCRNEKCVYMWTKNMSRFHDCRNWRACCHVLNILFTDHKLTIMLFGSDGTHCFAKKTSRDYKKRNPLHFWRNFAANHNQAHANLNRKRKNPSFYGIIVLTFHWLIQLSKHSFKFPFLYTFSLQSSKKRQVLEK